MPNITIKDLAKRLNLAVSTVSRALRDHPDISEDTKKRVQDMAAECNYQPNIIAQSLQNKRTNIIGVILPEIRHNFFSSAISGIEETAYKNGYAIMVCQSHETYEREVLNARTLAGQRVAGIIMSLAMETKDYKHLEQIQKQGVALVLFDRVADEVEACKVVVDDYAGAREAVTHLIRKGYKRIAHLGGPLHEYVSRNRFAGYQKALEEHEIAYDHTLVVTGGFHEHDGRSGIARLLKLPTPPDAVFTVNDPVAIGAYTFLKDIGLNIPNDIALVGFSNNPISAMIDPPLTTVNQPATEMGRIAARLMLKQLEASGKPFAPVTRVLKTDLVIRSSA